MEKTKIDRVIESFRNYMHMKEMMSANAVGKGGGGGSQTDPTGKDGLVGFDPVISFQKRQIKLPAGQRARWKSDKK
jgi:hypothetical protein